MSAYVCNLHHKFSGQIARRVGVALKVDINTSSLPQYVNDFMADHTPFSDFTATVKNEICRKICIILNVSPICHGFVFGKQ